MSSKAERFWIVFILRYAFGLFFIIAAINIFSYGGAHDFGPDKFARALSGGYESSWMGDLLPMVDIGSGQRDLVHPTYFFLYAMPFLFAGLSVPILTGIFLRPALAIAALLLVTLGVGSYVGAGKTLETMANDFFLAFLVCVALHYLSCTCGKDEAPGGPGDSAGTA